MVIGPSFIVKGVAPFTVYSARRADRRAFWEAVAAFVVEAKMEELRQGLDRFGNPMRALAASTIANRHSEMGPADPHAPPLQPAHGLSRTRSLFTVKPTPGLDGVVCWWAYDHHTGDSWGKILEYHRAGVGRLPKRDVIGLSPMSVMTVKSKAADWWLAYSFGIITPPAMREIEPVAVPKFTVDRVPRYVPKEPERAISKKKQRPSEIVVSGHQYTLQTGSAAKIREGLKEESFSGWHTHEQVKAKARELKTTRTATGGFRFHFKPPGAL